MRTRKIDLVPIIQRKLARDAEINSLMAKMDEANRVGFQLTEKDKARLLALLLEDVLDGIGGR